MKNFLIIANWKMQLSYNRSLVYTQEIAHALAHEAHQAEIVICPSYDALAGVKKIINNSSLYLGAQDCSAHAQGPYTGQIQSQSLAEIGCSYCIVGHSEMRALGQSNQEIVQKVNQLINVNIVPIICIGERTQSNNFLDELQDQLFPLITLLKTVSYKTIAIAYEPVWAIGSGITPSKQHIEQVFSYILTCWRNGNLAGQPTLIYGGSVDDKNLQSITTISNLSGLLVGGASLDSQKFKKIVRSCIIDKQ
ncbi:MAG: triose-phosphate isomerase [Candidatus Dependentiae bacterium]